MKYADFQQPGKSPTFKHDFEGLPYFYCISKLFLYINNCTITFSDNLLLRYFIGFY